MKSIIVCFILLIGMVFPNFVFADESSIVDPLALAKKIMYETARVLVSKDNMLVLDEVASYDWYVKVDTDSILPFLSDFRTTLTDFQSIEERRDLLYYMTEQSKSMAVSQLVPNAISIGVMAFSSGNPLRSLIAVGGTALSSYINYSTAKQQAALKLIEDEFELNQQQEYEITELYNRMFETISLLSSRYGFKNEDFASPETLKDFVNDVIIYSDSPDSLILTLLQSTYQRELSIFPEYWRALATAYYETNQFEAALNCIYEYEKIYVKTLYHDNDHAALMMIKAYCIYEILPESPEKYIEIGKALNDVLINGESSWSQIYYCVYMYKTISEKTGDVSWLDLAYTHLFDVVSMVSSQYQKDMESYVSGSFIAEMKKGIDANIKEKRELIASYQRVQNDDYAGKQEINDAKEREKELQKEIKELEDNKKAVDELEYTFLPPDSYLLVALSKELFDLADFKNTTNDPSFLTLYNEINSIITDIYSRNYLFNEPYPPMVLQMSYDHRVPALNPLSLFNGQDEAVLYVPMDYVTISTPEFTPDNTKIFIRLYYYEEFEYELSNWTYEIRKVGENNEKVLVFNFTIDDPVYTNLYVYGKAIPEIRIRFESQNILIKEAILTSVNEPEELMKGFKVKRFKHGDWEY